VKGSRSVATHVTEALLLRRVEYGEADLVVTLFTRALGRVAALARGARKSQRRFGGALEPFFTLSVRLEEKQSAELYVLSESSITRPRIGLLSDLSRMQAAGRALSWVRAASPPRTPEPEVWRLLESLLDNLSRPDRSADLELGAAGLSLLAAFGWGIDFERCVRCGKPCPAQQAASVDAERGGLVCRACGGGRRKLSSAERGRLARANAGDPDALEPEDAALALELVERALATHAGVEPG